MKYVIFIIDLIINDYVLFRDRFDIMSFRFSVVFINIPCLCRKGREVH